MKTILYSLFSILAFAALAGCAQKGPQPVPADAPAAVAVSDVGTLVAQATQDYIDYRSGNADFAWAITKGAQAYTTGDALVQDFTTVVKAWGGNTSDSQNFSDRLARIFKLKGITDPKQQAAIAAKAIPVGIQAAPGA